jgi:hypothetical protein
MNPFRFFNPFSKVQLLLHMDGANASTTFTDNSSVPKTITVNGSSQISTAQSKFGGASGLFSTNDKLTVSGAGLALGTGDYTIETWVYLTSLPNTQVGIIGADDWWIGISGGNAFFTTVKTGLFSIVNGSAASTNTWYHLAVTRASGTTKLFVNGVSVGSPGSNDTANQAATTVYVGAYTPSDPGMVGYLDDVRITVGYAFYTTNFTPPTQAFPNN